MAHERQLSKEDVLNREAESLSASASVRAEIGSYYMAVMRADTMVSLMQMLTDRPTGPALPDLMLRCASDPYPDRHWRPILLLPDPLPDPPPTDISHMNDVD
jgi:hypothetical protein